MARTLEQIIAAVKIDSKDNVIENIERILIDADYDLKKARSPRSKRSIKGTITFFASIHNHLKQE